MTHDYLAEANKLSHSISTLTEQIALVEEMHHCDKELQLRCDNIGSISIPGLCNDELKDDIIDLVLRRLNKVKEDLEDQFRMM